MDLAEVVDGLRTRLYYSEAQRAERAKAISAGKNPDKQQAQQQQQQGRHHEEEEEDDGLLDPELPSQGQLESMKVPWAFVAASVLKVLAEYPSGITSTILASEVQRRWNDTPSMAKLPPGGPSSTSGTYQTNAPLSDLSGQVIPTASQWVEGAAGLAKGILSSENKEKQQKQDLAGFLKKKKRTPLK